MTTDALVDDADPSTGRSWITARWAPPVMVVALLLLVAAPARIWLHAAMVSVGDPAVATSLRLLWVTAALAPAVLGVAVWLALRSRPPGSRFVVTALLAATLGMVTILPITPYVYSF